MSRERRPREDYHTSRRPEREDYHRKRRDEYDDRYPRESRDSRDRHSSRSHQRSDRPRDDKRDYDQKERQMPELKRGRLAKRKNRWGDEDDKVNIPGLPTSLPSDLTNEQYENYIIHMRIEELGRKLRLGDYIPFEKHSVSPEPTYGIDGKRTNTRDLRYRKVLEDEQHALVELGMRTILGFRPPADYKRPDKLNEKVYIPQRDFPEVNFIGLLIGPRGNTLKKMEAETGTKISIRGKGSVKEGKNRTEAMNLQDNDDELHCLVSGDTEDRVKAALVMINKIIQTASSVPEGQNELKRNQLRELAALNGTLRDDENQVCTNCGGNGHRRFECTESTNFTSSLVCRICNSVGHIARDCLQKNDTAILQAANQRDQNLDDEYANLMAELGGHGPGMIAPAPWVGPDMSGQNQWAQGAVGGYQQQGIANNPYGYPLPPMGYVPPPPGVQPPPPQQHQ